MSVTITAPLAAAANPAAALDTGGSLTVSTTYYYKIVAMKSGLASAGPFGPYGATLWGLSSAEISATPTSGNQTVDLTWDAVTDASGYLVYRTEISADYDPATAHMINDAGSSESLYGTTSNNYYTDNGARDIAKCLYLENGLPMAVISSSTEGSPDTSATIYAALIAGGYTNHTARVGDFSGYYFQYHFLCNIDIQGWWLIEKGINVYHEGTILFGNSTGGWTIGDRNSYPRYGASYYRKFVYSTLPHSSTNILRVYDSQMRDLSADFSTESCVSRGCSIVWEGKIYCENSLIQLNDLQVSASAEGYILDCSGRIGMQCSAKVFCNNTQWTYVSYFIYVYYANENVLFKNLTSKNIIRDMYFHKDSTAVYVDALNHQWEDDPPSAIASSHPTNLTVRRKYECDIKILDASGNAIVGAVVKIVDNLDNETNPEVSTSTGQVYITSGTATSGGNNTLTDTNKSWVVNALSDLVIEIYEGTGDGQEKSISSNTATVITTKGDWITNPDDTSKYRLKIHIQTHEYAGKAASPYYDTTTYSPHTLIIQKSGYEYYEKIFTTTRRLDLILLLRTNEPYTTSPYTITPLI